MLTHKLEKDVLLYKNQFDMFSHQLFNGYIIDRISLELDSLSFRIKYMIKNNKDIDKIDDKRFEFNNLALRLRSLFGELLKEFLYVIIQIPEYAHIEDIINVFAQDVEINTTYVKFKMVVISDNKRYLEYIDSKIDSSKPFNMYPDQYFRFTTDSYNDAIAKTYPELFDNKHQDVMGTGADGDVFCHSFTFQTSEDCNLCCTYCYQFAKSSMRMSFETAKEFINNLLADKYGYINRYNSPAIIIEFIGGEPFLEIDLTRKIYEYFLERCYELDHPWFSLHRVSICSNGLLYFEPEVQSFFKDYSQNISFNISIDGNKELHDSCRIQPNGEGSYDIAIKALNHYNSTYSKERNSKMTLAPSNIRYLFDSVVDFIKNDMKVINLNCVFEEGWNQETAKAEFHQLVKLADYLIDNDLDHIYLSIFNERQEDMQEKENDGNFCFKEGTSVLSENGNKDVKDIRVGDILYTASGNKHRVTKVTSYESSNNKILKVRGAFPIYCTSDHKVFAKKFISKNVYSEPNFYPVSELKRNDRIALPVLNIKNNKNNWIDEKTAYAIGIFLADGFVNIKTNEIIITPGYDENRYYFNALNEAKLTFRVFNGDTTIRYIIKRSLSGINERFFKVCLSCGHLAHNKHFPRIIFESPENIIRECIKGYCDTDGYTVNKTTRHQKAGLIKVNSVSRWLMNDLMILLRSIGDLPICYYNNREGKMMIQGREVNVRDRYEVYYFPNKTIEMTNFFKSDDTYPIIWSRVNAVIDDPESYIVYCPTVMPIDTIFEEHTIISNTIATRQCGGGSASMLSLRPNGEFYPCIRYMPTSIGNLSEVCIGNIKDGMVGRDEGSKIIKDLDENTRRAQNNDICYDCPISNDCASCSALGYTVFGSLKKRTNFICIQMIAEALANVYYWNRLRLKHPEYNISVRKNNVPTEWALLVVDSEELDELTLLQIVSHIIPYAD